MDRPLTRRRVLAAAGVAGLTGLAGCGGSGADPPTGAGTATPASGDHPTPSDDPGWDAPTDAPETDVAVETLIENMEIPWDIAFTGTGEMYVTERTGRVLRFDSGRVAEIARPQDAIDAGSLQPGSDERPWWVEGGEGGTLGVAVHPDYPDSEWLYVYYTARTATGKENRVVRYDVGAENVTQTEQRLVEGIPADTIHNGGRIRFGPDGNLWICCGDAGTGERAQDLSSLGGKVLRITPGGEPPPDNPDLGGDPRVFTYGHRNPQGIDWLPSGVPLVSEHGPSPGRDEVNVLLPGHNYGWPEVRAGPGVEEYGSYPDRTDVTPPLLNTGPTGRWAPTGATFYTGEALPGWHNRLVVGGLVSQSVYVVTLTPPGVEPPPLGETGRRFDADWMHPAFTATAHRVLTDVLGRVRHVAQSPSGELYAITSNRDGRASGAFPRERDDVLVRLTGA